MSVPPSPAVRIDRAIDVLLEGVPPGQAAATARIGPSERPLVRTAQALLAALEAPLVSPRFEARLGARLSGAVPASWILRHPGRLIVTGAVGSALGVGVTAYAVWRGSRRAGASHRVVGR
jgi:hypothetical protein